MKYVRLESAPDPDAAPGFFEVLAGGEVASVVRLVDWNLAGAAVATVLYDVTGDREAFADRTADLPEVEAAAFAPVDGERFFALVRVRVAAVPLLRRMLSVVTRQGIVVATPVVYRDGRVEARLVGETAVLGAALDAVPDAVDVEVREVGEFAAGRRAPVASLSDRQREALRVALERGYYDQPRGATHEDVAAALACAPSTAGEHLRKAEAKLVAAAVGPVDRE